MRLSNTLMMDVKLMPSTKKAFTLAEVLITLSILGVVAALTIPSLVNRQSDLAAQVKLKKAISNYEDIIGVYMAENEASDASGMLKTVNQVTCGNVTDYFKAVSFVSSANHCEFVTADGVAWKFDPATGNASVTDNKDADSARYAVTMWNANNRVNSNGRADGVNNTPTAAVPANPDANPPVVANPGTLVTTLYGSASLVDKTRTIVDAPTFLQGTFYCGKDKPAKVQGSGDDIKVACQ